MIKTGEDPSDIIKKKELWQMSDEGDLENIVAHIVKENPAVVEEYKKGKTQVAQFLVGQVMKEMKGQGNPAVVNEILKKKLSS